MKSKFVAKERSQLLNLIQREMELNGHNCDLNHIDVSLVVDMNSLFHGSNFNGDISKWDVSKVENMSRMFECSKFNGDISQWNVSNVKDMYGMFEGSYFNRTISKWNVSNATDMRYLFANSKFSHDVSDWKPYSLLLANKAFYECQSPVPYWIDSVIAENMQASIDSYSLAKELTESLNSASNSNRKPKI